ncbi:unnamed protein product [Brassica napus]|uniref:(rape) hypothetical protein n=1 Tax=Brassica napus TaxID=3708 RepID=A0A816TUV2_BRANA|nr:unnamed protein product [Brassica napus]
MDKGAAVWNPWLKQSRWIKAQASQPSYDNNDNMRVAERRYKTIGFYRTKYSPMWETQEFSSEEWKDSKLKPRQGDKSRQNKQATFFTRCGVSLHGNLYWIAFCDKTDPFYHLLNFDFSSEIFYSSLFCDLPCGMNHPRNALVLRVFRGDRFSLLKQCYKTKKIEIWVTKNKINVEDGDDVEEKGRLHVLYSSTMVTLLPCETQIIYLLF